MKLMRLRRPAVLVVLGVFVASTILSFIPQSAYAAPEQKYETLSREQQARSYAYYRAMNHCVPRLNDTIRADSAYYGLRTNPANGYWFGNGSSDRDAGPDEAYVSPFAGNDKGLRGCSYITATALEDYWVSDEYLAELNKNRPADKPYTAFSLFLELYMGYVWDGTGNWKVQDFANNDSWPRDSLKTFLNNMGVSIDYTPPVEYFLNLNAFTYKCHPKSLGEYADLTGDKENVDNESEKTDRNPVIKYTKLKLATDVGVVEYGYTFYSGGVDHTDFTAAEAASGTNEWWWGGSYPLYEGNSKTCSQMVDNINQHAGRYMAVLVSDICDALGYSTEGPLAVPASVAIACREGVTNKTPEYCEDSYSNDSAEQKACLLGQDTEIPAPDDPNSVVAGELTGESTTCAIPDIGWVVCPIVNFMAGANSTLYGVLQGLLVVKTDIVEADSSNLSYNAWQVMRSFANVGFVIVFLIIIFSQISSIGISNYGIKKMMPRLIIAAILVNVSFIICQVAVDVSNILGGSIVSLLDNTAVFGSTDSADDVGTIAGDILAGTLGIGAVVAGGAVAGAALSGGTVLGAAALLLPVLLAALLAIVVTVFILAARQVVIILLVVLAPLAFLAMLLPNTENLFKQWRKIFISMLLVYPMIGLLYGGSTLASKIVLGTGDPDALQAILGIIILFVPLLLTPSLLQASLKAVPALGGFASKLASRANSNLSGSAKKRLAPEFSKMLSNRAAGLSWTGKERYKKSRKDGVELERNEAGALVPKRDANGNYIKKKGGAKLDAKGNIIGPKRRTYSQLLGDRTKLTEKAIEANKAVADNNYGQRGLDGRTKMDRNIRAITDRAQTAGLDQERIGKIYTGRLKGRQLSGGSLESNITAQLEDAEGTVKVLDSKIGEEKSLRIEHGAENTAAEAMGVADMQTELTVAHRDADGNITGSSVETVDMKNLRDVSKVGFATEEATKASELRIQRDNKESGVASGSIQEQKGAEAGIKVYDTQQEEAFKTRQANEEPLMKLAEQQDAADRGISTLDEEQKARLEGVAKESETLEDLEKRKQTASQTLAEFHAQEEAELAERKKQGGDLFDSAAAEARFKAEAAASGKRFDSTIKELAGDKTPEELRKIQLGEKPTLPDASRYSGGASDPEFVKDYEAAEAAIETYEEKERQLAAAEGSGLREGLQAAAQEDYVAASRITQAEMDKTLGIDAKMQDDTEEGKRLLRDATGVGTQKRVRASAAKRLEADRQGDVAATEDLLERGATSRDESLALLGTDIYGEKLFDDAGNFVYKGESPEARQEVWNNYVRGRAKIGQPLDPNEDNSGPRVVPNEERLLDNVEQEALLRRTIKQGDKKANVRPTLKFLRDNVLKANERKAEVDGNPNATEEEKKEADQAVKNAVRLQAAAIQQYASTPGALSPFLSSGDQGAMVDGTFVREADDLVINTFGSEKLGDPGFAAKWNIDHFKDAAGVFEDLSRSPDELPQEEKAAVDARLAAENVQPVAEPADTAPQADKDAYDEYQKKFYRARIEKHFDDILAADGYTVPPEPSTTAPQEEKDAYNKAKERRDKERAKRLQSFADARKGIDQVDDNEAFKPDGRAHEQIFKIRNVMDTLQAAGAIPEPSADKGEPYRRKSYTDEPGVVETTPSGQQVYLRQEKVSTDIDPKGFVQKKYILDENGLEVPYVSGAPAPGQQPPTPSPSGGTPPTPLPPDNFVG